MADSTRTALHADRLRALAALVASLATLATSASSPAAARADGDPASDVLVSQSLFLPQDAGLTIDQQAQLDALLSAARRSGYPLRIAIIANTTDLGSITELWRQPENYARFLGQELSLVYRGTLLVVIPNGSGLHGPGANSAPQRNALATLHPNGSGSDLGATTISAVHGLASATGHPLSVGTASARETTAHTDYGALIALAGGAVLIALTWLMSLRARPSDHGHSLCAEAGHDPARTFGASRALSMAPRRAYANPPSPLAQRF